MMIGSNTANFNVKRSDTLSDLADSKFVQGALYAGLPAGVLLYLISRGITGKKIRLKDLLVSGLAGAAAGGAINELWGSPTPKPDPKILSSSPATSVAVVEGRLGPDVFSGNLGNISSAVQSQSGSTLLTPGSDAAFTPRFATPSTTGESDQQLNLTRVGDNYAGFVARLSQDAALACVTKTYSYNKSLEILARYNISPEDAKNILNSIDSQLVKTFVNSFRSTMYNNDISKLASQIDERMDLIDRRITQGSITQNSDNSIVFLHQNDRVELAKLIKLNLMSDLVLASTNLSESNFSASNPQQSVAYRIANTGIGNYLNNPSAYAQEVIRPIMIDMVASAKFRNFVDNMHYQDRATISSYYMTNSRIIDRYISEHPFAKYNRKSNSVIFQPLRSYLSGQRVSNDFGIPYFVHQIYSAADSTGISSGTVLRGSMLVTRFLPKTLAENRLSFGGGFYDIVDRPGGYLTDVVEGAVHNLPLSLPLGIVGGGAVYGRKFLGKNKPQVNWKSWDEWKEIGKHVGYGTGASALAVQGVSNILGIDSERRQRSDLRNLGVDIWNELNNSIGLGPTVMSSRVDDLFKRVSTPNLFVQQTEKKNYDKSYSSNCHIDDSGYINCIKLKIPNSEGSKEHEGSYEGYISSLVKRSNLQGFVGNKKVRYI